MSMPELPEVETVRRGLEPVLVGHRLVRVEQRRPNLRFPFPEQFKARLEGQRIERLDRRAKYLVAHLHGGEALIMHLGMTGRFTISAGTQADQGSAQLADFTHTAGGDGKHDHVVFETETGTTVTYNDARRFGFMDLTSSVQLAAHPLIRDIGIEPLGPELTPEFIAEAALGKRADLKAFLMDQRIISGLGNIYVCETLYRARLSPTKPASRIATVGGKPRHGAERLVPHIREVLSEAIGAGGSTLRDYQHTDGSLGYFQHAFAVYGREGEPCRTEGCTAVIERIVQSNRSTFYCPNCQKA
jgi:formamidopyrimidine-DNA glycosylase